MKASEKRRREARKLYVESLVPISFAKLAKKCRMSNPGVFRWQKVDTDKGLPHWRDLRKEFWAKKNEEKEVKELVKQTKQEIAEMMDYEKNRIESMKILVTLREKLADPKVLAVLIEQAKIRDVLDVLTRAEKSSIGLGFADKVVVIGATKPDDSIEAEYEVLED